MKPLLLLLLLLTHTYADTIVLSPAPCKLGCKNKDYARAGYSAGIESNSWQSQTQAQSAQNSQNNVAITGSSSASGSETSAYNLSATSQAFSSTGISA